MSPISSALPLSHALLALAVTAVWGTNFVIVHIALEHLPPLLFAALRFIGAFLPAALLVKRPDIPWRNLAAYGVLIGVGQFGILYFAIAGHITPGLASLVIQSQAFFTIAIVAVSGAGRPHRRQIAALLIALAGIAIILINTDGTTTPLGVALVLVAAAAWALSNIVVRATPDADMLGYVVWASVFSVPPLLALSFAFEGWPAIEAGLSSATAVTWAAVAWQAVGNTLFGYAAWSWLLARNAVADITPMTLMVPVFGMGTAALWLGEPLSSWKLAAAGLMMAGLALNVLQPRRAAAR